jgi:branched-chain amino acid aminotransferase
MSHGTHEYDDDPRNANISIHVNGELFHRDEAKISVFDSGFILGDGVWEGIRLHKGCLLFLDEHLRRLYEGAKALDLDIGVTASELTQRIHATLQANEMHSDVHIRLMITRGRKRTPYQDPRVTIGAASIVIIPEYKTASAEVAGHGINLFTVHVRRGPPDVQDNKINSHSKLNCILACIQATKAGADEALMLDTRGFVATCNSTHFFIVRDGQVWTSGGGYCLGGITRGNVIALCNEHGIAMSERDFSLIDVYGAQEAFVTGTFAGLVPVNNVDGRVIGNGGAGPVTQQLQSLYIEQIESLADKHSA